MTKLIISLLYYNFETCLLSLGTVNDHIFHIANGDDMIKTSIFTSSFSFVTKLLLAQNYLKANASLLPNVNYYHHLPLFHDN